MQEVTTHQRVDLDAVVSLFVLACKLGKGLAELKLHFVRAGQSGPGINVDTGLGEFDHHQGGANGECAASLLWQTLPEGETKEALTDLVAFTKRQDLNGSPFPRGTHVVQKPRCDLQPIPQDLRTIGNLQSVLAALRESGRTDQELVEFFFPVFDALVELRRKQIRAEHAFDAQARWLTPNVVFIERSELQLTGVAFRREAQAVIFSSVFPGAIGGQDGFGFGIVRRDDLKVDLNWLKGWEGFGEEDWFFHPQGFLACFGSQKSPKEMLSEVDPRALAARFEALLAEV